MGRVNAPTRTDRKENRLIYRPKHFVIQELVPPEIYATRGEAAWELMDASLMKVLDALREKFGPVIVNTWHSAKMVKAYGLYEESGLREWGTKTGGKFSQHKFGRSCDCKFRDVKILDVANYLIDHHAAEFPALTTIEDPEYTRTWLHIDTRNNPTSALRVVKP